MLIDHYIFAVSPPEPASFLMAAFFICCPSIYSVATSCWHSHGWSSIAGWSCLKAYSAEGNLATLAESCMSPWIDYGLYCSLSWVHLLLSTSIFKVIANWLSLLWDSLYCLLLFCPYVWLYQRRCWGLKAQKFQLTRDKLTFFSLLTPNLVCWNFGVFVDTAVKTKDISMSLPRKAFQKMWQLC